MQHRPYTEEMPKPKVLPRAPAELTQGQLRRIGEGVGKVVYASDGWVVKRERTNSEIQALIIIWKLLRRAEHILPATLHNRLLRHPSRRLRALRLLIQGGMSVVPKSLWLDARRRDLAGLHVPR